MGNCALVLNDLAVVPTAEEIKCDSVPRTNSKELIKQPTKQRLTQNVIKEILDQDIREFYDIDDQPVLGSGISGQVKMCIHKATKIRFALKTLNKQDISPERLLRLRNELACMAHLDHPNILRVHEVFENDRCIQLVMAYCRGGHLMDRLFSQQGRYFKEKVACKYIHTILTSVAYCHANNIVHRDLKLENILFETEDRDSDIKLIDFGLSQYSLPREVMRKYVGTSYYVAPEVIEGKYDAKCDVWSIGVIAYMLLSGVPPFYGTTDSETLMSIHAGNWQFDEYLFSTVSKEGRDFITKCLTKSPFWRPSAASALKHKWFNQLNTPLKDEENNLPSPQILHRFSTYMIRSTLARIFMGVIAHTLLPEQVAELRTQFNKFDISNRGQISIKDLKTILKQYKGYRDDYVSVIISSLDLDQKGRISYHEFLAATIRRSNIAEENVHLAFEIISNHHDRIVAADVQALLGDSKYEIESIMREVGMNMQSEITFQEFKAILDGENGGKGYLSATAEMQ